MKLKFTYFLTVFFTLTTASVLAQSKVGTSSYKNAVGLRIDFGRGATGFGPNFKHKFSTTASIDAAILFFEGDIVGLGADYEYNAAVAGAPGLQWYAGIGPQFLFRNETTDIGVRPVGGLDYKIPGAPLNFSFDWRPLFLFSPHTDAEAGRFGLSLRAAF